MEDIHLKGLIGTKMSPLWEALPEVTLASIFSYLHPRERLKMKYVCQAWHRVLTVPQVWKYFTHLGDNECTESNLSQDESLKLDLISCINDYGRHFRHVKVTFCDSDSFDIFTAISNVCSNIESIALCNDGKIAFPKGFRSLIHDFLQKNIHLKTVQMRGLTFTPASNNDPLPIGLQHCQTLQKLSLVNSFPSYSVSSLMYLVHLRELALDYNHVHYSLIKHLAGASLTKLSIRLHPKKQRLNNLSEEQWQDLARHKQLRVYFHVKVLGDLDEDLFKPSIPLVSLVLMTLTSLHYDKLCDTLANYGNTLEEFVDYNVLAPSCRHDEEDVTSSYNTSIVKMVQTCPRLHTLGMRDVLSSSTLLIVVFLNKKLQNVYVQAEMVRFRFHVPDEMLVPQEAIDFAQANWTEERMATAVSSCLGREWNLMSKNDYVETVAKEHDLIVGKRHIYFIDNSNSC
ncbi:F-box/LRR-repeat protein 21-like [Haliotis cracherodii]|uniref:F-box/LRR-repeat protein 21-like n=1 Tax=Haliotis cracherodii TaxID=6455 RepID=UPI0039EAE505